MADTNSNENIITISRLLADKQYKFQVRGIFADFEGPYSDASDICETKESLAAHLLKLSKACYPNASKYIPPIEENLKARNSAIKTKQMTIGIITVSIIYFEHLNFVKVLVHVHI